MTRVAVFGLGHVGKIVARMCIDSPELELGGAVVFTAEKDGLDIGTLVGRDPAGILATRDPERIARDPQVDAVVYCGLADPIAVAETLGHFAECGKDCVTVTGLIHPETALGVELAERLAVRARAGSSRIVGSGWNPGFLLDVLPVVWGLAIPGIRHLSAERICNVATWGPGVLDGLGVGMPPTGAQPDWTKHLPVEECVRLVSDALSLGVDRVDLRFESRIADRPRSASGRRIATGTVVGFRARGCGLVDGIEVLQLGWNCTFAMDAEIDGQVESLQLAINGETGVELTATGTTLVDAYPATAARALSIIGPLRELPSGLYRPDQVPLTRRRTGACSSSRSQ